MKRKSFLVFGVSLLMSHAASAHEGHNHDAPTMIKAPKGGVIKALDESRVEVVPKGKEVKIYLYDKEMKPRDASGFKITAKAELPRSKKIQAVEFMAKGNILEGSFDAQGSHRYTLRLSVTDSKTNRTDEISFTIEPKN